MKTMKKITCILLAVILSFSVTMPAEAAKKKTISKKNATKIVKDITEYLTEYCTYGASEGYPEVKFNAVFKTQMACKLCKPYKLDKKGKNSLQLSKAEKRDLKGSTLSYFKEKDVKKNMKNLFGTTKIKVKPLAMYDAFEKKVKGKKQKKILVLSPGGNFRITKQKYGARNIKITGKTTKKMRFDVGWYYGVDEKGNMCYDDSKAVGEKFWKGGTYTITLKPANNKYGCIITNIKEHWREPLSSYMGAY